MAVPPLGISLLLPEICEPEAALRPPGKPIVTSNKHKEADWRDYLLRVSQFSSGIFLAREFFTGTLLGVTGMTLLTGTTIFAGAWLEQNRVLQAWQRYSDRCEKQIDVFKMTNDELKIRNGELKVEISALRTHIASLITLQKSIGQHVDKLRLLDRAIGEREKELRATNTLYKELLKKYESVCDSLNRVERAFNERVTELAQITARLEAHERRVRA